MSKDSILSQSPDRLSEVAILLKHADKLVRNGNLSQALEEVAKARSQDPRNLYALAYEERVRSLLTIQNKSTANAPSSSGAPSVVVPASLEHISNLAIVEAQRNAELAQRQAHELELRNREAEERHKNDEARKIAIQEKIATFLGRAEASEHSEDYNRALDEIARAYLLDPTSDSVRRAEERILKSQDACRSREVKERQRRRVREAEELEAILRAQAASLQKEKEEKQRKQEEARRSAQAVKVREYLERAHQMLDEGKLDEALGELAFVVVIDPLNEEVLTLDRQIREAQERRQCAKLEALRKEEEEEQKKREAVRDSVRQHIENAEQLAHENKYAEALRVVARAYVLDPVNALVQECESKLLAAQEQADARSEAERQKEADTVRQHQLAELRRIEQEERERVERGEAAESEVKRRLDKERVAECLKKARAFLSANRHEDALGEVALAFVVDPFDEDVKTLELEILALQEEARRSRDAKTAPSQSENPGEISGNTRGDDVRGHAARARKFVASKQFDEALVEVVLGIAIDPNDAELKTLEQTILRAQQTSMELSPRESGKDQQDNISRDERDRLVRIHLTAAEEFQNEEEFGRALDEIAQAYVIDPLNSDIQKFETRIRQNETRKEQQAAKVLKLVYPNGHTATGTD